MDGQNFSFSDMDGIFKFSSMHIRTLSKGIKPALQ